MRRTWKWKLGFFFILFLIVNFFLFRILTKRVSPILLAYASQKSEKLATLIINDAISRKVVKELTTDNLFSFTRNSQGEIVSIDFNPIIVNKILSTTTNTIEMSLKYVEEGRMEELDLSDTIDVEYTDAFKHGHFYEVPLGVFFKNPFLSNLGPKIPVKLDLVGSILSNVETNITNYGINNAMIEVYVHIEVKMQVILPFVSDIIKVDTLVPIAMKLIQGSVPKYYGGNLSSPLLSLSPTD